MLQKSILCDGQLLVLCHHWSVHQDHGQNSLRWADLPFVRLVRWAYHARLGQNAVSTDEDCYRLRRLRLAATRGRRRRRWRYSFEIAADYCAVLYDAFAAQNDVLRAQDGRFP